ncbi:hypothetical protein LZ554_001416 [Drepanopeziza brunnea f. sp. 'monogermtubi']|nr:hypothetical protein LZ554_001416 [Drepanopeziza brunnea f. sp. 'monogermtubi']
METHPIHGRGFSNHPIEPADLSSVSSAGGWLTDTAIRQIVAAKGNTSPSSRVHLVDPTWLTHWALDNRPDLATLERNNAVPAFLAATRDPAVQGLALPFNEGNSHWVTIYLNLEEGGAIYFNSLGGSGLNARRLMEDFYAKFGALSPRRTGPPSALRWQVDTGCARQADGSSCGIYTVRNCLDLLERRVPGGERLSAGQIANFRWNGRGVLEGILRGQREVGG